MTALRIKYGNLEQNIELDNKKNFEFQGKYIIKESFLKSYQLGKSRMFEKSTQKP